MKNFFFKRVFENIKIANDFHWLLHLEANNMDNPDEIRGYYSNLYEDFLDILDKDQPEWYDNFKIQKTFRETTVKTANMIKEVHGKKEA